MDPKCVNLRERFGKDYWLGWDPAYAPSYNPKSVEDPWMVTVPCEYGIIYPHGGDLLAVEVDRHANQAKKLAAVPGVNLHQDGNGEKTFLFHVDLFEQVAEIVEPRRRSHRLNEKQRRMLELEAAQTCR